MPSEQLPDLAFENDITSLADDHKHIWNSVELLGEYQSQAGDELTCSKLLEKVCRYFDDDLLTWVC